MSRITNNQIMEAMNSIIAKLDTMDNRISALESKSKSAKSKPTVSIQLDKEESRSLKELSKDINITNADDSKKNNNNDFSNFQKKMYNTTWPAYGFTAKQTATKACNALKNKGLEVVQMTSRYCRVNGVIRRIDKEKDSVTVYCIRPKKEVSVESRKELNAIAKKITGATEYRISLQ